MNSLKTKSCSARSSVGAKLCARASTARTSFTASLRNVGLAGIHTMSLGYLISRSNDAVESGIKMHSLSGVL